MSSILPPRRRSPPGARTWLLACVLALTASLAAAPAKKPAAGKYIFYPPAPAAPRLQFLVSYSDERDLGKKVSKFATFVTGEVAPSQPIIKPYGVTIVSNQMFVCDTGNRSIAILDLTAKTMRRFAPPGMSMLGVPISVAIDADGTRFVADTGRNQVLIYGSDESYIGAIGEENAIRPTGVVLTKDRLYMTDLKGHCVRVYDKGKRELLFTIPRNPEAEEEQEPGKLFMPVALALDGRGRLCVSDVASCRVKIYDTEGKHLHTLGSAGDLPGQFARPKGVAVDREGRVYVVDAASQVCQVFDPDGKLLLAFGEPDGSAAPLDLPAAVAVDYANVPLFQKMAAPEFVVEHLVVISNQLGERKISIYGLGHAK